MESSEDYEKEKENNPHSQETAGTLITMGFVPASDKFRADTFRAADNTSIKDAYNTLFYQNNSVMPPGDVKHFTIKSAIIGTIILTWMLCLGRNSLTIRTHQRFQIGFSQ
jgi:hypothetical protein